MISFLRLLALPAATLAIIAPLAINAQDLSSSYITRRDQKYYPEHEQHFKRELEAQQQLQWHTPSVIKKMGSDDAGEKFYFHYFGFGGSEEHTAEAINATNYLGAPIALHTNHDRPHINLFGRNIFSRDFECPADTTSCSSIGSDLCCPTGETCVTVSGSVGCCPSGETCTDTVNSCDTSAGYTSCPNSSNGGCCVPGASCEGTGCVFYGTSTIIATAATSTVRASASSAAASSDGTTVVVAATSVSGYTTTVTVTESASGHTTTIVSATTVTPSSSTTSTTTTRQSTCTLGFISCPASLGGGCCASGLTCGTDSLCLGSPTTTTTMTDSSSATASAPVRPTSVSSDTSVSAATATSTTSNDVCPTGYYMCSAYYLGGCCQVGRNCDTTSCPSTSSTTLATSGATVVVPAAASASETQGSCANGWYSCAASAGGGCCPSGYGCGATSCSATVSGEQNTGKEAPNSGNVLGWAWSFLIVAVGTGIGMICL